MISSAWPRPFLPLTAIIRALSVLTVNSPSLVFNLATGRTAPLTRRVYWPLLPLFRAAFNRLTCCPLWFLPCFQSVGCSAPDPPHPPPSCPAGCFLTWDLLSCLLSALRSPRFPRRNPIVTASLKGRGGHISRLLGCNLHQRDHASAPLARQYTNEVSAPHLSSTGSKHELPSTGTLLWSDREGQGGGGAGNVKY